MIFELQVPNLSIIAILWSKDFGDFENFLELGPTTHVSIFSTKTQKSS